MSEPTSMFTNVGNIPPKKFWVWSWWCMTQKSDKTIAKLPSLTFCRSTHYNTYYLLQQERRRLWYRVRIASSSSSPIIVPHSISVPSAFTTLSLCHNNRGVSRRMLLSTKLLALALFGGISMASTGAFVPRQASKNNIHAHILRMPQLAVTPSQTSLSSRINILDNNSSSINSSNLLVDIDIKVKGALTGLAIVASLWVAPAFMATIADHFPMIDNHAIIASSVANAKEMASGTGTRVNKDPESLLRYGLPINNKEVCAHRGSFLGSRFRIHLPPFLSSVYLIIRLSRW